MSKKEESQLIVGLDIGTSKIAAIIGEVADDNSIHILGLGRSPSLGLKRGMVVDVEATVNSIEQAVKEAELMSGTKIDSVFAGIAGSHIRSISSTGMVAIQNHEIDEVDVERVLEAARAQKIPPDQRILHVIENEYVIDQNDGIRHPVGMSGVRLDANVHLVCASASAMQNISKCVNRSGLEVDEIILEQLASSYAVLVDDERDLGVCLVDIGAGTTDIAIYDQGSLVHSAVIAFAGDQITHEIAITLRTPHRAAEEIKTNYACLDPHLIEADAEIQVHGIGKRVQSPLKLSTLMDMVRPGYEHLLESIQKEIEMAGKSEAITSGYVLCGGAASMPGLQQLAEGVLNVPVRIGSPEGFTGVESIASHPSYATGIGLLRYGAKRNRRGGSSRPRGFFEELKRVAKSWFSAPE